MIRWLRSLWVNPRKVSTSCLTHHATAATKTGWTDGPRWPSQQERLARLQRRAALRVVEQKQRAK